jgi:hypothetical protein
MTEGGPDSSDLGRTPPYLRYCAGAPKLRYPPRKGEGGQRHALDICERVDAGSRRFGWHGVGQSARHASNRTGHWTKRLAPAGNKSFPSNAADRNIGGEGVCIG